MYNVSENKINISGKEMTKDEELFEEQIRLNEARAEVTCWYCTCFLFWRLF